MSDFDSVKNMLFLCILLLLEVSLELPPLGLPENKKMGRNINEKTMKKYPNECEHTPNLNVNVIQHKTKLSFR